MKEDEERSWKQEMPADAVLIRQAGSLHFYFSKSEHAFLVGASGCQATPVRLTRQEIADLLDVFDQQTREKEAELLAELEADEEDF